MSKSHPHPLTCTLDHFENSKAVLVFKLSERDTQELHLASRYLPKDIKKGDTLYLEFSTEKETKEKQQNLARQILEEILKGK